MKFILGILATIGFGIATHMIFPQWWGVVIATGLVAAGIGFKSWKSFMLGFLGLALLWGGYAAFLNNGNDGILAARVGTLMQGQTTFTLLIVTAFLGGLLGGFAGLSGSLLRQALE